MVKYFDYYNLDYHLLKKNAKEYKFINDRVRDEYFLGLERAKKKAYDVIPFEKEENEYEPGTREWVEKEITNCKKNIFHFCQYIKILDPTASLIPYQPYLYQQQYYRTLMDNRYIISDKCRQVGFSVGTYVYLLWHALFKMHQTIEIISINDDLSKDFLRKLKKTYKSMPDWMLSIPLFQTGAAVGGTDNEHALGFGNGSLIKSLPRREEGARSGALSILVFDEAAFIDYMDKQWRGSYFTIAKSQQAKALVISTRNGTVGKGEWYYKRLTAAQNGESNFNLIEVDWWEVPDFLINPKWLDDTYRETDRDTFLQEVCKMWLVAGDTVLDKDKLLNYKVEEHEYNKVFNTETEKFEEIKNLHIWKKPREDTGYAVVADVGTGSAKSFSACHVFDLEDNSQVAEFKDKINTNDYAKLLIKVANYYNGAIIVVERNNPGEAVVSDLVNVHKYKNLYRRKRKKAQYRDWGWVTSTKTRPLVINDLIEDFDNDNILLRSQRTINEALSFVWDEKSGKPKASGGAQDDLVLAWGIFCHLKEHLYDVMKDLIAPLASEEPESKIFGIAYKTEVEKHFRDYYWVYGEKTQKKIKENIDLDKPQKTYVGPIAD